MGNSELLILDNVSKHLVKISPSSPPAPAITIYSKLDFKVAIFLKFLRELTTSSLGSTACSYVKLSVDPEGRLYGN